jgi:hypothetical protein
MRIVQSFKDVERAKRLASQNRLAFKNILNMGSPVSQGSPSAPESTPSVVPANALYTIAGDPLKTIAGAYITRIP